MSDFKFSCPHCKQHLQVNEQFSGRQIQCPNCNHLIRIPAAPGKTAQYKAESGMTWATFVPPGNVDGAKTPKLPPKKTKE
jgi:DNA-directed RNA polymerase subunit RPC12/RpoP